MKTLYRTATTALAVCVAAAPAAAHTGHVTSGLGAGLAHPFMGLDHLLAMVAVGLWAAMQPTGRAWRAPALFVAVLTAGAAVGMAGVEVPFVEPGILASVILFGLMIAGATLLPPAAAMTAIAAFAFLHGHAHGTEAVGSVAGYMTGFIAASAALHLGGYAAGSMLRQIRYALPAAGLVIAAAGAAMMAS
jgi:urease accessory protein